MDKLFGYACSGAEHDTPWGVIYAFDDKLFGEVFVTKAALGESDQIDIGKENYKVLAILREFHISGRKIVICSDSQKTKLHDFRSGIVDPYTIDELLNIFPTGIKEVQDRALMNMTKFSSQYGAEIESFGMYDFFARDRDEMYFLMKVMIENGIISAKIHETASGPAIFKDLRIRERGWTRIEALSKGSDSSQVFVAMWFDKTMNEAFEAIRRSCSDLSLSAFRIDRKEFNNEISGEILYEINRSRFLIADVTGQRPGVYFEAGYAFGKGKPVIWSCRSDEIKLVHFDTRQYNHVVWSDPDELSDKIKERIQGSILAVEA
jgi:hypothetical protein